MLCSTRKVLLFTTLPSVFVAPFSIAVINFPGTITRCLAREAVWHAARGGVKERGDGPFRSRQIVLKCKKWKWRNNWQLQFLRNNIAAALLCTSVAYCALQYWKNILLESSVCTTFPSASCCVLQVPDSTADLKKRVAQRAYRKTNSENYPWNEKYSSTQIIFLSVAFPTHNAEQEISVSGEWSQRNVWPS